MIVVSFGHVYIYLGTRVLNKIVEKFRPITLSCMSPAVKFGKAEAFLYAPCVLRFDCNSVLTKNVSYKPTLYFGFPYFRKIALFKDVLEFNKIVCVLLNINL